MDQKTVLVMLRAIQDSVAQLDKEHTFYDECLCNCSENNEHYEILTRKLSKISTQTKDLDSVYTALCGFIKEETQIASEDVKYKATLEDGECLGVKIE